MPGIVEEVSECVSVISVIGTDISVRFENGHQLKLSVAKRGGTICEIDFMKGDRAELITAVGNSHDIRRIKPFDIPRQFDGQITYTDNVQFALIDDKIVIYDKYAIESLEIGEKVTGFFILGDYHRKNDYYMKRAIEIESKKSICLSTHGMRFKNAVPYMEIQYEVPFGLYETITSNNVGAIMKILNEYLPKQELTMENIADNFHTLLFLEEIELKRTFELYKTDNCRIDREKKNFSIYCGDVEELRPPISRGDGMIAIEMKYMDRYSRWKREERYYRAMVHRVHSDRYIIRFISDWFKNSINKSNPERYHVEFQYNRTVSIRKHAGVDAALLKFDERMFFPTELVTKPPQIDVTMEDGKLLLNTEEKTVEIPWFNKQLNDEQKCSVMICLRGECRPLPFIIFGPPGTGKTATLVETILQVYTHLPESRILIATQSNSAANVVTTRLLSDKIDISSIDKAILRLVSNATIDKHKVPESLYKICASISLNANDEDFDEDYAIKRTLSYELLREHRIVLSTCGGIGALLDKDVMFTHVFIDEASQCHEPEALLPISLIEPENGQIILAGDPLQLSPIVLSNHAKDRGLSYSMLERYIDRYGNIKTVEMKDGDDFDNRLVVELKKNYRALPSLLKFYSDRFYKSKLEATINKDDNESKYLGHIYRMSFRDEQVFGIRFYNVDGENKRINGRRSWHNPYEAQMLVNWMQCLIDVAKTKERDIGIITPYYAQVLCVKKLLDKAKIEKKSDIKVGTVEEFQGEERRIILFSVVKTSGDEKALRFVHCGKRLNTAVSRGRNLVIVFGCARALSINANWSALIDYCKQNNTYIEDKTHAPILNENDD